MTYVDNNPLCFLSGMNRIFCGLIDKELNVPKERRFFPIPARKNKVQRMIDQMGKPDMCWGGVGITGHIAFDELPEQGVAITDEEFLALSRRPFGALIGTFPASPTFKATVRKINQKKCAGLLEAAYITPRG